MAEKGVEEQVLAMERLRIVHQTTYYSADCVIEDV